MKIYVLSELSPLNHHIGWSCSYGLAEVLATSCNAQFIYPRPEGLTSVADLDGRPNLIKRVWQRYSKSWYQLDELPTLDEGPNILLIVGLSGSFPLSIFTLKPLLDQFDLKIAYILDGFDANHLEHTLTAYLDHLFVISAEQVDAIQNRLSIPTSFLPLGFNTLPQPYSARRTIDIIGYGRTQPEVHQCLQRHYNQSAESQHIYFHSTFDRGTVRDRQEHNTLHNRLLSLSKISLCFEVSGVPRFCGQSPLLYRWLEGWATGCAIVGKQPFGRGVTELMDWPDSTFELPDQPDEWIPFFELLLADEERLQQVSFRNYQECRRRHDWRYRVKSMFEQVGIPIPDQLQQEITQLQKSVSAIADAPAQAKILATDQTIETKQTQANCQLDALRTMR